MSDQEQRPVSHTDEPTEQDEDVEGHKKVATQADEPDVEGHKYSNKPVNKPAL
jgi:hypothetical protein